MLADRFQAESDRVAAKATQAQQARVDRDNFIKIQFPALDTAFSGMVTAVSGSHPKLAVIKTPVTDTFAGRGFATLNKTFIEMRSTLYGPLERVTFTPAL